MNRNKSFVSYNLVRNNAFLGNNPIIATTAENKRRICDNCNNCNKIIGPTETICDHNEAKRAFKAGEGVVMPKKLDGQPVGNFCKFFVLKKDEFVSSSTEEVSFESSTETDTSMPTPAEKILFVSPKRSRYFYPVGYVFPKSVNLDQVISFASYQEAEESGRESKM
jgi:hypothetical protein